MTDQSPPDFAAFAASRSAPLFRSAYLLTADHDSAEELLQETLVRVCGRWRRVAAADSPEAYAHRIMINLANDRWRRWRRTAPLADLTTEPNPADQYQHADTRDQLIRALRTLPMGMRTTVVLRYFHDMTDSQIAATMGISPSTARSQVTRGLARLRDHLPASPTHEAPDTHTAPTHTGGTR